MYITIDRKVIRVEDDSTEIERKERARKSMRAQDLRLKTIEADKKRRGYCLNCHVLLTIHGKCGKCGTIWKFHGRK